MDNLRLYFVTYNVATKSPSQDLNSLLDFPSTYNKNRPLPDFYIIGLQEVKSQPQNMVIDSIFTDPWTSAIGKIVGKLGYIRVKTERLQGIVLLTYTLTKHLTHLRDIETQYTKTGLGGMWGNKGAVSIRFNIYGVSLCIVNSHLAAHDHLLADRVSEYNTIVQSHTYHVRDTINIMYHDYVVWIGDLNFRMLEGVKECETSESIVEQIDAVEKDNYKDLLRYDQLKSVMEIGEAFSELKEHDVRFAPTYKYNIGTNSYDLKRRPAWTDRVLYKVVPDNYENVTLRADVLSYKSLTQYTLSDHKPVVAEFNIKVRRECRPKESQQRGASLSYSSVDVASIPKSPVAARSSLSLGNPLLMTYSTGEMQGVPKPIELPGEEKAEEEVFSNYVDKNVEFTHISPMWYLGDADFLTRLSLSSDVEINQNDWIGIFDADFQSLDEYITYEYLAKVSGGVEAGSEVRTFVLSFPVGCGVRVPGFYRFIYFSQPSNDIKSVLGISEPFEVSSREEKRTLASMGTSTFQKDVAGTSSVAQQTTTSDSLFSDLATLDVASLSRHFSNDLSID